MASEQTQRRLAAILSADVVGYSRLMAEDEDATVRRLTRYREEIAVLVRQHRGRVVDAPGDNLLAEFPTATDAVEAATEIQRVIRARNAAVPEGRRMEFRIGVHLGEARVEGKRLYGDAVNVAARLEGLAEPGGICISDDVLHQVQRKLELEFEDLGPQEVKNIPNPVHVYRVREASAGSAKVAPAPRRVTPRVVAASVGAAALVAIAAAAYFFGVRTPPEGGAPLTSIAVLPFDDLSPGGDQTWLANGMAEELIESLSRIEQLRVIARTSAFSLGGADIESIGAKLHVGSVVEGSVRRSGDQLRLTAQLIRVADGSHLWSARYDRKLDDVFAAQAELAQEIAEAIRTELGIEDDWLGLSNSRYAPRDVRAWELVRRGSELTISDFAAETLQQAGKLYQDAIEIDPGFSVAHTFLGWNHYILWLFGHDRSDQRLERARVSQQQALELDPSNPGAHEFFAHRSIIEGDLEGAERRLARAIEARPKDSGLRVRYAEVLAHTGRLEEALVQAELAAELDPLFFFPQETLAYMHLLAGNYDSAIQKAELALELNQASRATWTLAMAYHRKGMDGAGLEAVLRYLPKEYEAPLRTGFDERGWRGWNLAITEVLAKTTGSPCGGLHPFQGARACARAGEADAMYRCLDEEIVVFGDWRLGLKVDPEWDAYRDDPRFTALLRRVNLAE